VVTVHDAFTTRVFGDSSLIFVTDYHPLSKTIAEHHLGSANRFGTRPSLIVGEQVLWGYIVQLASAIKSVHSANLAVRCMEPSKVLLTDKNRIRFSACAILDVVHSEAQRPLPDLQQEDLLHFGKLILSIATNTVLPPLAPAHAMKAAMNHLERLYTSELREIVLWLLTPAQPTLMKTIDELLRGIAPHIVTSYDSALHTQDILNSELSRELENSRIARLMMKLGTINERQDYEGDRNWSENGDRYMLKLFRDYVFHQVDSNGNAVVDLGHIIRCLNKLDVGVDEKILLTSRDEQTTFIVTYKDLKKQVTSAFGDLTKPIRPNRGF
jgi:PAB-dependent poly(A)-specific ribonuclease subunit 3